MSNPTRRLRGRRAVEQRRRRLERTHGLCERCLGEGRFKHLNQRKVTIATVVNHIDPLAFGGSDEDENTENLCDPCDRIVTAQQFGFEQKPTKGDDGWVTTTGQV